MTVPDPWRLGIAEAAGAIAAGRLSPVALTEAFLDRIAAIDGGIGAYVRVLEAEALAAARAAEREIADGDHRGPLHGIPVAVKDIIDVAGVPTTCCSHQRWSGPPAAEDAEAVRRLRQAGAVVLGKLVTHEFAYGGPSFDLPLPPARNPWNPEHFTGGSSSGSGAAVAAGLCMAALGSDTAGSIRMPAAACGLAGFKGTYGRVSVRGVEPLAPSLDHCGPLAWTAADAALVLQALAGHDPGDPTSVRRPAPDLAGAVAAADAGLTGLRVGYVRHFHADDVASSAASVAAVDAAAAVFETLGAEVRELRLSSLHDYNAVCLTLMVSEALAQHLPTMQRRPEAYGRIFFDRVAAGASLTAADYVAAQRLRRALIDETLAAHETVDVLLYAGALGAAPPLTDPGLEFGLYHRPLITGVANVTGCPAMVLCCGFDEAGLPLSLQLSAKPWDEATLARTAVAYERATPWRDRRPATRGVAA